MPPWCQYAWLLPAGPHHNSASSLCSETQDSNTTIFEINVRRKEIPIVTLVGECSTLSFLKDLRVLSSIGQFQILFSCRVCGSSKWWFSTCRHKNEEKAAQSHAPKTHYMCSEMSLQRCSQRPQTMEVLSCNTNNCSLLSITTVWVKPAKCSKCHPKQKLGIRNRSWMCHNMVSREKAVFCFFF